MAMPKRQFRINFTLMGQDLISWMAEIVNQCISKSVVIDRSLKRAAADADHFRVQCHSWTSVSPERIGRS